MISFLLLYLFIVRTCFATNVKERDVYAKLGENIDFCCELNPEENQAVALSYGNLRLLSLARMMKYELFDANSRDFFDSHPGYSMKNLTEPVESLCIEKKNPGAELSDNDMKFQCDLYDKMGLGTIIATEKITVRIYEPPKIAALPTQLESVVNGPVSLKCSATGRPDLALRWINEANGRIYVEEKAAPPSDGELELPLTLQNVTADQDGQRLICEATTSYPPEQSNVRQYTEISVNYPPQIKYDANPIYTALGAEEKITFTVHGKPKPEVQCDQMNDSEPRELEELPAEQPGVNSYMLRINAVTVDDLGGYTCSATNKFGSDRLVLAFTLAPSKPEVISPEFSSHADYYLLGWRAKSRAPMRNATFRIQSIGSDAEAKEEIRTVSMSDPMVAKGNTSSEVEQEFWHHLANLSHNSEHRVHIQACNEYACNEFDLKKPDVTFRTNKEYSSNKIDPEILMKPPSASLRAAALREVKDLKDTAMTKTASSLLTLLVLTFVIY